VTAPSLSTPAGRSVGWLGRFYRSTIGRKIVMAVTGLILVGFLVVHMVGNLLVHRGPQAINEYAEFLKSNLALLWGTRITLLGAVVLHAHAALTLASRARAARPAGYQTLTRQASSWSARLMRWGGIVLLVFIVFHLLHFTTGQVLPSLFVAVKSTRTVRSFQASGWWRPISSRWPRSVSTSTTARACPRPSANHRTGKVPGAASHGSCHWP
jgi:succinate dehydrogenase/fumarate reductase cytochrome b subunit